MKFSTALRTWFCCIFILSITQLPGQNTLFRTIGHQIEGSEGRNVIQAADGGYFMSYYIYYAGKAIGCLTKLNCGGIVEWERFYEEDFNALPVDIIPQSDNGCLLLLSVRLVFGTYQNAVLRIDAAGNTIWTQRVEMQAANMTGCMAQHSDGSIYVCGADSIPVQGHIGTALAKINSSGQLVWLKHYGENIDHAPRVLTVTPDHKIAIAGQAVILGDPFTNIFVFTVNEDGNFIKRRIYTTYYDDEVHSICTDASGNICLTGQSYFINSQWDMFFLKLNGQLDIQQSKLYDAGTPQGEQARFITATNKNTYAVFGDEGAFNERNPMMMKLDSDGGIIWARHYTISPLFTNYIFHGSQCNDGGFLMTGDARPITQFRIAPFIKTDSIGDMGCNNSIFSISSRTETFVTNDTTLTEYSSPTSPDTSAVPYSQFPMPTINTTFCQSFIPCGNFNWKTDTICPKPCYTFSETNYLADSWEWVFVNGVPGSSSNQFPPQVCYTQAGPHEVMLTLSNQNGSVTYTETINPEMECPLVIPNIFTPNGDGQNEIWKATGIFEPFSLKVFNRWGMEIFSSDTPGTWWDGKSDAGNTAIEGVYFYVLNLPESDRHFKGTIELIR